MKLSLILLLIFSARAKAFQVDTDSKGLYKNIVKNSLGQKIEIAPPVLSPTDDDTYSSKIPIIQLLDDISLQENDWFPFRWRKNSPSLPTLCKSINTQYQAPRNRKLKARKLIGLDNEPSEYWFNNRIHTFGNTGFYGGMHAAVAPFATNLIDTNAYDGVDARKKVSPLR